MQDALGQIVGNSVDGNYTGRLRVFPPVGRVIAGDNLRGVKVARGNHLRVACEEAKARRHNSKALYSQTHHTTFGLVRHHLSVENSLSLDQIAPRIPPKIELVSPAASRKP